jgi:hypothetical protein
MIINLRLIVSDIIEPLSQQDRGTAIGFAKKCFCGIPPQQREKSKDYLKLT